MVIINEHFKETLNKLGICPEGVAAVEKCAGKVEKTKSFNKKFEALINEYLYPEAHDFGKLFDKAKLLSIMYGVKEYTLDFVLLVRMAEVMHQKYKERGLSDELFWNTIMDLRYKFDECVDCKEVYGTFVAGWNTEFYNLRRFCLGRYQYDMSTFGKEDYTTSAGITIKKGEKVLGFHIPSSGVPLTDEVRLDSFKKAYEFFEDYRREDGLMIFVCGSWLLYEGHREFLPEKSNILKFMSDFEIIESEEKDKFDDAWRVFGKYGYKSPKNWPENTSMRKAFKQRVLSGGKTGHGFGVIVFDGEKIIR